MLAGSFRLPPEIGAQVKAAIDDETNRRFRSHGKGAQETHDAYAADAFADMVCDAGTRARTKAFVNVLIDHRALVRGSARPGETCEIPGVGPVNAAWVRHIRGDAFVAAVIKHGRDIKTVAHFGRHVNAELRTALLARDRRECDVEGCWCRNYLEIDHIKDVSKGGVTSLANLRYGCAVDHDRKSRGWELGPPHPLTGKRRLRPPRARRRE
jgi:hypothetical protein